MPKYVACRFEGSARDYTYHHDIDGLAAGDVVQVETTRGIANVTVTGVVSKPKFATKPILGRKPEEKLE
jgi:hypothetical protein